MSTLRAVAGFGIAVMSAAAVLGLSPRAYAATYGTCEGMSAKNTPLTAVSASSPPVVLVHGWDGGPASMHAIGEHLRRDLSVTPLYFDYEAHNSSWASAPVIAGCLATYVNTASDRYLQAGGDGAVTVVAHSMGGLAAMFSSRVGYPAEPDSDALGGLVTIDTPYLGSPFGNQWIARALEVILARHPTSLAPQPTPGSDASICLAAHNPPSNVLPDGCAHPPYLPASVPITELAGDISVKRTLFGIPLYTVDLDTDGVVPVTSAHSYGNSGADAGAPRGTRAALPTVKCTVSFDQVAAVASAQGLVAGGGKGIFAGLADLLSPTIFSDATALDQQLSGKTGSALLAFLTAAYLSAPCSHAGMLNDPESLTLVTQAVRDYIAQSAPTGPPLSIQSSCADWYAATFQTRKAFAARVRPNVPVTGGIPDDPKLAQASMYGFIFGECDRAKKAGLNPSTVSMTRVLNVDFPGTGNTSGTP
jgi:pimeloyl-ACP methyl ester carboxylesterase